MERILKQRDRLLASSARLVGLTSTGVALLMLAAPGSMPSATLIVTLPLFLAVVAAQYRMGTTKALVWPVLVVAAVLALIIQLRIEAAGLMPAGTSTIPLGIADAMRVLAAGSAASACILLSISLGRMLALAATFVATMMVVPIVFAGDRMAATAIVATVVGWAAAVATGSVLSAGLLRASRRISNIGRAHRSERQASETEAQRRQGARLLHDTVLATLTLLAHAGVGVTSDALRRQAGDDARLLRQLRLSSVPLTMGASSASSDEPGSVATAERDTFGDTLDSVKERFAAIGLDVSWHGAASVTLPPARLDQFLLAVSECLENVRRHSGTAEAHVTITDDDKTVRALITDNGVGFDPSEVPAGKLGFRESIVGRLQEVGGNARVFSAQGAGTTVVLEVPR